MKSQKVYHCGARRATLRKRESAALRSLLDSESMRRNRCGSHRHHNQSAPSESRRQRCADDATRLFHIAVCVARAQLFFPALTADQSTCRDAEMLAFAAILATLDDPFYDPPEHLVKYETPQQRRSYTAWASKLRDDLIGDDSGYDQVVPPRSDARSAGGDGWFTDEFSAAGTVVGLQIRFFKVESVKASEGAMRLKVWVR